MRKDAQMGQNAEGLSRQNCAPCWFLVSPLMRRVKDSVALSGKRLGTQCQASNHAKGSVPSKEIQLTQPHTALLPHSLKGNSRHLASLPELESSATWSDRQEGSARRACYCL